LPATSWKLYQRGIVAIVGIGQVGYRSAIPELEYKELDYEAAVRACDDAGINPREEIDTFVHAQEDMWEGYSITSEYSPDQVGAALRTICTVPGEGLQALVNAWMHIATGYFDTAMVVSHGKPSEIISINEVREYALDPVYERPLKINPLVQHAFEASSFMQEYKLSREALAYVVSKNKRNALRNPRAAYPTNITREDALNYEEEISPLTRLDIAQYADGAVVILLASSRRAKKITDNPVYIRGVGWASQTSSLLLKDYKTFPHIREASRKSLEMAGIRRPRRQIHLAEVEDKVSYMELQSLLAYGIFEGKELKQVVKRGLTERDGEIPVNVSGGALGMGNLLEATGLARVYEAVLQLRGEAGQMQLDRADVAVVNACREAPASTCVSLVLSTEP